MQVDRHAHDDRHADEIHGIDRMAGSLSYCGQDAVGQIRPKDSGVGPGCLGLHEFDRGAASRGFGGRDGGHDPGCIRQTGPDGRAGPTQQSAERDRVRRPDHGGAAWPEPCRWTCASG